MRIFGGNHGRLSHCGNDHPVFIQFVEFYNLFARWKDLVSYPMSEEEMYRLMNRLTEMQFNMRHHTIEGLREQYCIRNETGADLWVDFYQLAGSGDRLTPMIRPHLLDELWKFPEEVPLWLPIAEDADAMLVRDSLRASMVTYGLSYNFADDYAQHIRMGSKRRHEPLVDERDGKRRMFQEAPEQADPTRNRPINVMLRQLHIESRLRRDQDDILRRMNALQIESQQQAASKRINDDPGMSFDRKRRR